MQRELMGRNQVQRASPVVKIGSIFGGPNPSYKLRGFNSRHRLLQDR